MEHVNLAMKGNSGRILFGPAMVAVVRHAYKLFVMHINWKLAKVAVVRHAYKLETETNAKG